MKSILLITLALLSASLTHAQNSADTNPNGQKAPPPISSISDAETVNFKEAPIGVQNRVAQQGVTMPLQSLSKTRLGRAEIYEAEFLDNSLAVRLQMLPDGTPLGLYLTSATQKQRIDEAAGAQRSSAAQRINEAAGAQRSSGVQQPNGSSQGQEEISIPLYEEQLSVGKQSVKSGQVTIRKIVTTETVSQPVQLRRERVVIERQPAGTAPVKTEVRTQKPYTVDPNTVDE